MQQQQKTGMWGRYALFVLLSFGILALNIYFNPPKPQKPRPRQQGVAQQGALDNKPEEDKRPDPEPGEEKGEPEADLPAPKGEAAEPEEQEVPAQERPDKEPEAAPAGRAPAKPRLVTIGSANPNSPFRMLVVATNQGAAVAWAELNSPRYGNLEDRGGYLGRLVRDETIRGKGCPVEVVGPGTPAAAAGLKRGDLITAVEKQKVDGCESLREALRKKKPGQTVQLTVLREDKQLTLSATLSRRPLEVVRPEGKDPLSFLLTLRRLDEVRLDDLIEAEKAGDDDDSKKRVDKPRDRSVDLELAGLDLRTGTWHIENEESFDDGKPHTEVTFFRELPKYGLRISKTYRLAQAPQQETNNPDYPAYHLTLHVKIENIGDRVRKVAYQLDGPTGLPIEGKWYANKVSRSWGAAGLRDVMVAWQGHDPEMISCIKIANDSLNLWKEEAGQPDQADQLLDFIGVDAQYFSAFLIPQRENPREIWFDELQPLRVGPVDKDWKKTTNTSCRLVSTARELEPDGKPLEHSFTIFLGPKKPALLAQYGMKEVVYYGWFGWATIPMLHVLHFFHDYVVFNYGLAIIMLTVLVRSCMYPLSRKQAMGAQKMQELQPEIRRLHEKYKNNPQAKMQAQQDLFRKHNYNPLSGCLIIFIQLPIFIGLYRGLMVDVELRQAPLISESIRWCSNLSAPDMLYDWSGFWKAVGWTSVNEGLGFLGLGPFFNLLPILTIALFIVQQKMFMPPAADEQQAMQQKVMKFMMIFMGFLFFKVASGLCIYFIASSLWGVAERKLLPRTSPSRPGDPAKSPRPSTSRLPQPGPAQPKPVEPKAPRVGSNHDGATARKKKKKKRTRGRR